MMMYTHASQLEQLAPKIDVPAVAGTFEKVWPPKAVGRGTKQNALIQLADSKFMFSFWDRPDITSYQGHSVTITGGMKTDEYNGKKSVNVPKSAVISGGQGQPAPVMQTPPVAPPPQVPTASQVVAQLPPIHPQPLHVKQELNKAANLMLHCIEASEYVRDQAEAGGIVLDPEWQRAVASSLYIDAQKKGLAARVESGVYSLARNTASTMAPSELRQHPAPPLPEPDPDSDCPF